MDTTQLLLASMIPDEVTVSHHSSGMTLKTLAGASFRRNTLMNCRVASEPDRLPNARYTASRYHPRVVLGR